MGRRKTKNRTHVAPPSALSSSGPPKTFVVSSGEVGSATKTLVRDLRQMLEPNTASRLKERKRNKIRDFVAMSGPLGVTHLIAVSQSQSTSDQDQLEEMGSVNLKLVKMPRGPTLSFKVLRYALSKDILAAFRRPHSPGKEFSSDAMLILNGFGNAAEQSKQMALTAKFFQNLFPTIRVQTMALTQARRIVLVSYNPVTKVIDLRHYLISVRQVGISKQVRRIVEGTQSIPLLSNATKRVSKSIPNLNKANDVADYILATSNAEFGYASSASEAESDVEGDTTGQSASEAESGDEAETTSSKLVKLPQDYVGRGNKRVRGGAAAKRAVKLTELGPRMELGLVKIQEGVEGIDEGEVLFHEFIHKSKKEAKEIIHSIEKKKVEKAKRRKEQEANVARKKAEKKSKSPSKETADKDASSVHDKLDDADEDEEMMDDEEDSDLDPIEIDDLR